jgi:hypothetical protein
MQKARVEARARDHLSWLLPPASSEVPLVAVTPAERARAEPLLFLYNRVLHGEQTISRANIQSSSRIIGYIATGTPTNIAPARTRDKSVHAMPSSPTASA